MRSVTAFLVALVCAAISCDVLAQPFPNKAVRIIVAFPPGGGVDIVARAMGPKLTEIWNQPVIVENRPGASGVIGTEAAARSLPDGHTLFLGTLGNLNYSSSGPGGAPHLGVELFKSMTKVNLVHIPYKGSGPSFVDLLAGHVSLTCDSQLQSLPYIKAGRLRALAVLGGKRSPLLPDVATVGETVPGYELTNWFGMTVPAATPRELVNRLYGDVSKVLQQADFRARIVSMGADVVGSTPEQFGAFMRAETEKWGRVIREANIRAE